MAYKFEKIPLPKELDKRVRLTDDQREDIKTLYGLGGISFAQLGRDFEVSATLIQIIVKPDYARAQKETAKRRTEYPGYFDKERQLESNRKHRKRKKLLLDEGII